MSITFSLRAADGSPVCTVNHGADCEVAEHLLDEYAHPWSGYCVPCFMDNQAACPVCSLDVNVTNTNGQMLIERLGVPFDWYGQFDPSDLLGRVMTANVGRDDSGIDQSVDRSEGRAIWIDCGLPAGYYEQKFGVLADLAVAAQAQGLVVSWC
jgi:hypothetical protein